VIPPEPLELGGGIEVVVGQWSATSSSWNTGRGPATLVQLSLRAGRRQDMRHAFGRLLTDLDGLSPEALRASSRAVRFELERDAGVLRFEGRFQSGSGAGQFVFVPRPAYVGALRAAGYHGIDLERAYLLAVLDVSRAFVEDMAALGYSGLPFDVLVACRVQGADPAFVRALRGEGYDGLSADDLVALRVHGGTADFVAELRRLGYARLSTQQLVSLLIHGVTAPFVRELQALGYRSLPPEDLVSLRIHGVTTEFVRHVTRQRRGAVPVARLVDLRLNQGPASPR
jgi:hypothetical protein